MAIPTFDATENYDSLQILTKAQLAALASSIETHFNTYIKLNIEQLALDVFGNSYSLDNDGSANEATNLKTAAALLADNETVTGAWTFSGGVTFSNTVSSSSTFTSSGQNRVKCYITTTNQSISDSTVTALNMTAESYDVGGNHDNSTNNQRITIPTGASGVWTFSGHVTFAANNTGRRELALFKNGSQVSIEKEFSPDGTEQTTLNIYYEDQVSVNDYYELKVYQSSGGSLNVIAGESSTFFCGKKVW